MFRFVFGSARRALTALALFAAFYACFGLALSVFQERIVYQPFPQAFEDCDVLAGAERITFRGTRMYFKDNGPGIVVFYHGNAGSACDRAFLAMIFERAGYSYLLPEYAGYSNDTVTPSHARVKNDVHNVLAFLEEKKLTDVAVVGESIGSGAAAYHVHETLLPPRAILLFSPFTNLTAIARKRFWFYPVSFMVRDAFDVLDLLSTYTGKVVIIHGTDDTIIPIDLGRTLFSSLSAEGKTFVEISGADHNTLFAFPETFDALSLFSKDGTRF